MENYKKLMHAQQRMALFYAWVCVRHPLVMHPPQHDAWGNNFMGLVSWYLRKENLPVEGRSYVRSYHWWLRQWASTGGVLIGGQPMSADEASDLNDLRQLPWKCIRLEPDRLQGFKVSYEPENCAVKIWITLKFKSQKNYRWASLELHRKSYSVLEVYNSALPENQKFFTPGNKPTKSMTLGRFALIHTYGAQPAIPAGFSPTPAPQANHHICPLIDGHSDGCCGNARHIMWGDKRSNAVDRLCHKYPADVVPCRYSFFRETSFETKPPNNCWLESQEM